MTNRLNLLGDLIDKALKSGATDADAIIINSTSLSTEVRLGKLVDIERSENMAVALRVLINGQQAIVSTADFSTQSLNNILERVIAMAKVTPSNPHLFLASKEQMVHNFVELDLYDTNEPSAESLIEKAKITEDFALANKEITNSEGSSASYQSGKIYFATSKGFQHSYQTSSSSLSLSVLAGLNENMQTDYAYSVARFAQDLKSPEEIGLEAAKRVISKLNPRKLITSEMPVIFDRRVARGLISALASAVNGSLISRGTSFLLGNLEQEIFNNQINIIDDPFIIKGLGSRPFDGEAIAGTKLNIIEKGILKTYLLDLQTASKLKMRTTGHATRSLVSAPSPGISNLYLEPGKISQADMIKSIKRGLLITEVFGHGANIITGDYSQGVSGFYIENGKIAYPVSEITIASNLKYMFKHMSPANDLKFESSINSPTIFIEKMTIAGV